MASTILIVDDEKNILLSLSQSLQLAGYHTELAQTGQLALDVISARPVDAVLLDVRLPDLDGLTVLERLLDTISYEAPDQNGKSYTIDAAYVDGHLAALVQDQDLSRYIL